MYLYGSSNLPISGSCHDAALQVLFIDGFFSVQLGIDFFSNPAREIGPIVSLYLRYSDSVMAFNQNAK